MPMLISLMAADNAYQLNSIRYTVAGVLSMSGVKKRVEEADDSQEGIRIGESTGFYLYF